MASHAATWSYRLLLPAARPAGYVHGQLPPTTATVVTRQT